MKLRVICRIIIFDKNRNKIILVKNKKGKYWYPPGGGWEYDKENILECAKREVKEETGIKIKIFCLFYAQEYRPSPDIACFEIFWLAEPIGKVPDIICHQDIDPQGCVEKVGWFSKKDTCNIKVFPIFMKKDFWKNIKHKRTFRNIFRI